MSGCAGADAAGVGGVHRQRAVLGPGRVAARCRRHAQPGARAGSYALRDQSGLRGRDPGRGEGGDHRSGHRGPDPGGGPRGQGAGAGPGRAADPGRAAVRDHPSRYPGRPGEGKEAAGAGGDGHAIGHGCARPEPKGHIRRNEKRKKPGSPDGRDPPRETGTRVKPGFTFTGTGEDGPPGGYGSWRLSTGTPGQPDLIVALDPITTEDCDHRYQARGHDPGVKLRHLSQIRHATCTGPSCRRPSTQADFEHNTPYEAGGRSCLCNGDPLCKR